MKPEASKGSCWSRFLDKVDIFSYIPVPQSFPVSTRNSKIGSLIAIILFLAYIIYDFVQFITNNVPSVNTYPVLLPAQPMAMPAVAVGFIYGSALNQTLTNNSYFSFTLQQAQAPLGQKATYTNFSMVNNCAPTWLGNMTQSYQNLSCIDPSHLKLEGVYLGTAMSYFVRLQVNLCDNSSTANNCSTQDELQSMTSGGRIFIFIEKAPYVDLKSGKLTNPPVSYDLYNFFLVPYLYNRVNINIQSNTYEIYPDFLTSFTVKNYPLLQILNTDFQNSNVSIYNPMNTLSVSFLLSPRAYVYEIHYQTILTHISLWGALWGVLFSIFAIVFLGYNRNKFRKERPDWEQFDKKVDNIEQKIVVGGTNQNGKEVVKETELVDISTLRKNLVTDSE